MRLILSTTLGARATAPYLVWGVRAIWVRDVVCALVGLLGESSVWDEEESDRCNTAKLKPGVRTMTIEGAGGWRMTVPGLTGPLWRSRLQVRGSGHGGVVIVQICTYIHVLMVDIWSPSLKDIFFQQSEDVTKNKPQIKQSLP